MPAAIVRLLGDLALRRCELVRLDLGDVDLEAGTVMVQGKGKRAKAPVAFPEPTRRALAEWIVIRGVAPGPLFLGRDGERMSVHAVNRLLRRLGARAGISRSSPHQVRHAAITRALDVTQGDIRRVARFARHRDIRATAIYDDNRRLMAGDVAALVAGE
jgi:integrase/recombinase XerC